MLGIDIFAELIWSGSSIGQCLNIINPKTMAVVSGAGSVNIGAIINGEFKVQNNSIQFQYPCKQYYSLKNGSLIWGFGIRDFYVADINSGTVKESLASHNGNERIVRIDILDYKIPLLYVDILKTNWGNDINRGKIFNPTSNKITDSINEYRGVIFPLRNDKLLFEKFPRSLPADWKTGNDFKSELSDNVLTEKLNDAKVYVWPISYSFSNNLMIGFNNINDKDIYYTIKWDDTFEDVSIEPFSFQRDPDRYLWDHFEISPDGKWAKTVSKPKKSDQRTDDITFFAVNDSFPQSLSPPVYGGRSTRDGGGCFVETDDWGTVYVDISPEAPGYLVVYKMSEVMNKVVEKMRNMGR